MTIDLRRAAIRIALVVAVCSTAGGAGAHEPAAEGTRDDTVIVPLMSTPLDGLPGKEGSMLTVEYAPGASTAAHRHNAHTFVYVLQGSIVMQVAGSAPVTLVAGQTFYEAPSDVHTVSKNASATESAKFLVFFVKEAGAPPVIPES